MTIIHVACAGTEHMGRVEGEQWKKPHKRQMIVLHEAVRIQYIPDKQGNVVMSLNDLKKRQLGPGGPVETKYEGTVYLNPGPNTIYIWPLETGGDLYRIYKETLEIKNILKGTEPTIVSPQQQARTPMGPRRTKH